MPSTPTAQNTALSLLLMLDLAAIPIVWSYSASDAANRWLAHLEQAADGEQTRALQQPPRELAEQWRAHAATRVGTELTLLRHHRIWAAGFLGGCFCATCVVVGAGAWAPFCTTHGPHGLQVWPWLVMPLPGWAYLPSAWAARFVRGLFGGVFDDISRELVGLDYEQLLRACQLHGARLVLVGAYLFLLVAPLQLHRGHSSASASHLRGWLGQYLLLMLAGPVALVASVYSLQYEAASPWVWLGYAMLFSSLLEPHLLAALERREAASDALGIAPHLLCGPRQCARRLGASAVLTPPHGAFSPSARWEGAHTGHVFKRGVYGVGYYLDEEEGVVDPLVRSEMDMRANFFASGGLPSAYVKAKVLWRERLDVMHLARGSMDEASYKQWVIDAALRIRYLASAD